MWLKSSSTQQQNKIKGFFNEKNLNDKNRFKSTNICLVVLSKGETREIVGQATNKVIMAKNFLRT